MSLILGKALSGAEAGYQIERSLRFNSADSAYLSRTAGSPTNAYIWTVSFWAKFPAVPAGSTNLINGGNSTPNWLYNYIDTSGTWQIFAPNTGAFIYLVTTQVFRDPSAWYHFVYSVDTTQATASNRFKLYVNGVQVTSFSAATYPGQNTTFFWNQNGIAQRIGSTTGSGGSNLYLTEVYGIDGQALDPTSFGEFNPDTGVWQPIAYTGTYGTNGFYLNFSDNSGTTSTTLGKDYSGNGNNWTPNNFSVTAGAGNDSLVDSPTRSGTDTGAGGEVRGNYATLNPLAMTGTYSNGNLDFTTAAADSTLISTIAVSSGKWYCEITPTAITANCQIGIVAATARNGFAPTNTNQHPSIVYVSNTGNKFINGTGTAYGATYTTNDVIGVALDLDNLTLQFYKNGVGQGSITGVTSGTYCFAVGDGDSVNTWSGVSNFGQRPFAYTAPSGFKALCTTNLPEPVIADGGEYFNAVLYTGNGSTQSISGVGFQPDWVWIKNRGTATDHGLFDAVRGVTKRLASNLTNAETTEVNSLTAFNTDGFSVGATQDFNQNGVGLVAWNWKANGTGVSNTDGTITSTVSANTTSGFSIVTYTTTGANATVGHGLGVAPSLIIVKSRNTTVGWTTYHASLGNTQYVQLNTTAAAATDATAWNNTSPTSSVFSLGTAWASWNYVAYCFAEVAGFSKFGSYTGNGSADGPFIFTGFRPRWIMVKRTNAIGNWQILDTARSPYNVSNANLYANLSNAEVNGGNEDMDILSNGWKPRNASASFNVNGSTYIYAAFAENPVKYSLAR